MISFRFKMLDTKLICLYNSFTRKNIEILSFPQYFSLGKILVS